MTEIQVLDIRVPAEIIHNWGWFLAFGIGLMLLGILAIVHSVAATVVSMPYISHLNDQTFAYVTDGGLGQAQVSSGSGANGLL